MMLSFISKPSISTRSWFRVCSRSSFPPPKPAPLWRPTASISSMKMMHGEFCLAWANRSRTREAPTPTNISTKSEPEIAEEGHPGLAGHGPRQQRLAGAGRAEQQHALGDARPELLELLGVLEELLDLLELLDGLVDAGHVLEGDLGRVDAHLPGPALAEAHHLGAAPLHAPHDEDHETDDEHDRQQQRQQAGPRRAAALGRHRDFGVLGQKLGEQRGVGVGDGVGAARGGDLDRLGARVDEHGLHVAAVELADEALAATLVGVLDGTGAALAPHDHLHDHEKDDDDQQGDDDAPQSAHVGSPRSRYRTSGALYVPHIEAGQSRGARPPARKCRRFDASPTAEWPSRRHHHAMPPAPAARPVSVPAPARRLPHGEPVAGDHRVDVTLQVVGQRRHLV